MNILTDILSLLKRRQYVKDLKKNDVLVVGIHEEPDMLGVASPIPYKSVKLIEVQDLIEQNNCSYVNIDNDTGTNPVGIYKDTTVDPCEVNLRSLSGVGNNISVVKNNNEIEISTTGEPNDGENVGEGKHVYKDKTGETLRFRTLLSTDESINIGDLGNELDFSLNPITSTTTGQGWARYDDTQYTDQEKSLLVIKDDPAVPLPNNAGFKIETYMNQITPFYDDSQKIKPIKEGDAFTMVVTFKASTGNVEQTHMDLALKSLGSTPYERVSKTLKFTKGNNQEQNFYESFKFYADADFIANGNQMTIKAIGDDILVWGVIYYIEKTFNA